MTAKDYELFCNLVSLNQAQMKNIMSKYLRNKYKTVIETDSYIMALGDIPIALVAHMDTVFSSPAKEVYYDKEKQVIWSPDGLGADDRSGVYGIIQLIQRGLRPMVILTTDEEIGGIGAIKCALDYPDGPPQKLKYIIELDRQGMNDCVFYQCRTPQFIEYIESFGFEFAYGSFSDITFLMDEWQICATNLSIGYLDEHDFVERLFVAHMESTIDKVEQMLRAEEIPDFVYYEQRQTFPAQCEYCGEIVDASELIEVKTADRCKCCCIDCLLKADIMWCESCGEPFEPNDTSTTFCYDRRSVMECTKTSKKQ